MMVVMVMGNRLGRHVMVVPVMMVVMDRVMHDVMMRVVVVVNRRRGDRRDRGETDNHRRGDQQFLKHSLSP